jgi:hypothetical protein
VSTTTVYRNAITELRDIYRLVDTRGNHVEALRQAGYDTGYDCQYHEQFSNLHSLYVEAWNKGASTLAVYAKLFGEEVSYRMGKAAERLAWPTINSPSCFDCMDTGVTGWGFPCRVCQ